MAKTIKFRLAAILGIVAIALTFFAGVNPAHAELTPVPNIDLSRVNNSTLTIHKYVADTANPAQGQPGNGTQITDPSSLGKPLSGVQFKITRVEKNGFNINLSNQENWASIQDLNGIPVADAVAKVRTAPYSLGTANVVTTNDQGVATQGNLQFGLYLVEEVAPGNNNVTAPAQPFLVTLPYGNGNPWNYDVHVYPKNTLGKEITKVVSDPVTTSEEQAVTWTIDSPVPAAASYSKASIVDTLDLRLTYVSNSVVVTAVNEVAGTRTKLVAGDFTESLSGQTLTVTLTPQGLAKMVSGGRLVVDFATIVTGTGIIPNTVTSYVNDSVFQLNPGDPRVPTTYWGSFEAVKYDSVNQTTPLANAKFAVYNTEADAKNGVNPVGTYTTGPDGKISGKLYIGQSDIDFTSPQSRDYFIKEIAAPPGYILDNSVRKMTMTPTAVYTLSITNQKEFIPGLPLTGSQGTVLMIVVGTLLVASGVGFAMYGKRRKAATNTQAEN